MTNTTLLTSKTNWRDMSLLLLILAYPALPFNYLPAEIYGIFNNYLYVAVIMGILAYGSYKLNFDLIKNEVNREIVITSICLITFWFWVVCGLGISYVNGNYAAYGFVKLRNFTVLAVLPSFTLLFLINQYSDGNRFLFNLATIWLILIIITHIVYLFIILKGSYNLSFLLTNRLNSNYLLYLVGIDRSKHFFSNPIWISRQISYCLLIFSFVSLWYPYYKRILCLILFLTGLFLMIWAGSRGPIIAFLCGLTYLISKRGLSKSYKQLIIFAVIGLILIFTIIAIVGNASNIRLFYKSLEIIKGGSLAEKNFIRLKFYKNVITYKNYTTANIYGLGLGSYDLHSDNIKIDATDFHYRYPHNIILEIFFELGWIGIFLFICGFVILPIYLYRVSAYKTDFIIVSIAIYICVFINSLFSGDLKGNEMLPKMLILLSVAVINAKNIRQNEQRDY